MKKQFWFFVGVALLFTDLLSAQDASKKEEKALLSAGPVNFGAFIDGYYAYDFKNSAYHERTYTTQPFHVNEPNVNLAYIEAKVNEERFRGRLAPHYGTSVKANYAAEPEWAKYIQEAVIGARATDKLWFDAGVYFSHLGLENFVSKENWTYTRSLAAEFSPYYQTGAKATYEWSNQFSTQFHVLNGWQHIQQNGSSKAIGLQLAFSPSEKVSATYNNFVGQENDERWRVFNDFIFKFKLSEAVQFAALYDIGLEENESGGNSVWQVYGLFARYEFTPKFSLTARGEQFFDRNQVIVATGTPSGFQATGASVNADFVLHKQVLWRTELRRLWAKDSIYPAKAGISGTDTFAVTSLAVTL